MPDLAVDIVRLAKKALPVPAYRFLHSGVSKALGAAQHVNAYAFAARNGMPNFLLWFGVAPGDDLLCTTVLRELRTRGNQNIWMVSNHPEIFLMTEDASKIVSVSERVKEFARIWRREIRYLEYAVSDAYDHSVPPKRHIIAELCARAGVVGPVKLQPYMVLSEAEKSSGSWAANKIVIQSSGLASRFLMLNKQWYPERFQAVVDALSKYYEFIQLGSPADPLLEGVNDLRGKTNIRESASILYNARLYVGNVGFLMHLARATDCPSVIVYGGREAPWQSGYSCNTNLYNAVHCAPCWRWNGCDFDRKCMAEIESRAVVAGIEEMLGKRRELLPADITTI
jgi:hypothetical protein